MGKNFSDIYGNKVTGDNIGEVTSVLRDIQGNNLGSQDVRQHIINAAEASPHKKSGPVVPSEDFAKKDLEGRMAGVLRGLTNPKTGDLDMKKISHLPPHVQMGLQHSMETADVIGQAIQSAGGSVTGARAHRNQVFLNTAFKNPDVLRYATETVQTHANVPASTRKVATTQLAKLPQHPEIVAATPTAPAVTQVAALDL